MNQQAVIVVETEYQELAVTLNREESTIAKRRRKGRNASSVIGGLCAAAQSDVIAANLCADEARTGETVVQMATKMLNLRQFGHCWVS